MFSNACGATIIYERVALLSAPRMANMSTISTIGYEPIATELLSYLLRAWPMAKRVIDLEIEKNKRLTHGYNKLNPHSFSTGLLFAIFFATKDW